MAGYGTVLYDTGVTTTIDFSLTITNVTPAQGSVDGGSLLTITGTGFPPALAGWSGNTIKIGTSDCTPVASNGTTV